MSDSDAILEALMSRIQAGDGEALAEFIELRRRPLTAFIERSLSDSLRRKVEPQDIFQETAISALNTLDGARLEGRDPFGWLCQLAECRIIDAHRRFFGSQKRAASREVGLHAPAADSDQGLIDLLVASVTTPSQAFSRNQREFKLLEALGSLPEDNREALRLRYIEGLPTREIAEQFGKTDGAVRVLLTRSLAKLRVLLADDSDFKPQ